MKFAAMPLNWITEFTLDQIDNIWFDRHDPEQTTPRVPVKLLLNVQSDQGPHSTLLVD